MGDDCVFCKIMEGDVPCEKVYEDEKVKAFLDRNPISKGHTLIVPKNHVENIHESEDMEYIWESLVKISNAVKNCLNPEGMKIIQNNGEKAGQSVFHLHLHIIPVYNDTEIELSANRTKLENGKNISTQIADEINRKR